MSSPPIYATCVGTITPVGFSPESAAAAMRAGIDGFGELPYVDDAGEPIIGAMVPGLAADLRGHARLVEIFSLLVESISERLPEGLGISDAPMILCIREPERPGAKATGIVGAVESRLGFKFRREGSSHIARGHVAAFEAIAAARQGILKGIAEAYIVAAVDTFIDARSLHWLNSAGRLKTSTETDGVIPGEAGCAILVTKQPLSHAPIAIRGLGFGTETATVLNDEPMLGLGMTSAVREAIREASVAMHEIDYRLSDVAGESYAFEELVLAQSRLMRKVRESQVLWNPAGSIGDCGAAQGLVQLAWAEQAFVKGYAPGPVGLAHGSAAAGGRAALVVAG